MKRLDVVCRQRCHIEPCSPANSRDRLRCAIVDSSRLPGFLTDMMTNMARQNAHGNPTAERQMVPTWNGPIASFSHPLKRGCSSTLFNDLSRMVSTLLPLHRSGHTNANCSLLVARTCLPCHSSPTLHWTKMHFNEFLPPVRMMRLGQSLQLF